jgi:RHS repeat-associated protein
VNYVYANRLRASLNLVQPTALTWVQNYSYDAARRLTGITSPAGDFNYTLGGASSASPLIKRLLLPNGAFITNSYDNVARLSSTALKKNSQANLDSYAYGYNQVNQRTNVVRTAGDYVNYTYDNIGELKTASGKESGGVTNRWQEQFGYAYDAAGNLNQRTNNALVQTFNVNSLNELTTAANSGKLTVAGATTAAATNVMVNTLNAVLYADTTFAATNLPLANGNNTFTAIGKDAAGHMATNTVNVYLPTNAFVYDLNGNLLNDGRRYFTYDDENELTSVTLSNAWRSEYVYDGKMRRRIDREYTWNSGAWQLAAETYYVYDGNLVLQERLGGNIPAVTYTRGRDLSGSLQGAGGIGGLLARTDFNGSAYYNADGNGNVTMLLNANQNVAAKYLYDPYGNTLAMSGQLTSANTYRFSSKEWNANAGLYYYLYRFYDPNLQRWPNRDPLGDIGSDILRTRQQLNKHFMETFGSENLFTFVANAPTEFTDTDGRVKFPPLPPDDGTDQWEQECQNRCLKICQNAPCPDACGVCCFNQCAERKRPDLSCYLTQRSGPKPKLTK